MLTRLGKSAARLGNLEPQETNEAVERACRIAPAQWRRRQSFAIRLIAAGPKRCARARPDSFGNYVERVRQATCS